MLRALSIPVTNVRGPLYMEQVLAGIHQGNHRRLHITFAYAQVQDEVNLCCRIPEELAAFVEGQLFAHYPEIRLFALGEQELEPAAGSTTWTAHLTLTPTLLPIKRYGQFEDSLNRQTADPLTVILTCLAGSKHSTFVPLIEVCVTPASGKLQERARRTVHMLAGSFLRNRPRLAKLLTAFALSRSRLLLFFGWVLSRWVRSRDHAEAGPSDASASRLHEREDDLQSATDKVGHLLFEVTISLSVSAPEQFAAEAKRKIHEMAGAFGQFNSPRLASFRLGRIRRQRRSRKPRPGFLMSTEELATIFHPPTAVVRAPTMSSVESREFEPPVTLPSPDEHADLAVIGKSVFRSTRQLCGILPDDRRRHLYCVGKTGQGKSTLLQRLLATDIAAGRGVALIDPHGDLCDTVLSSVPSHRTNDVILLDAGDAGHPFSFNVFYCPDAARRPLVASGIISAFRKLYGEFWGPRMEHILRNAVLALLEVPGTSLLSLLRVLSEASYREWILARVSDPVVRAFWRSEFAVLPQKFQVEAIAPIQNKVGHFVSSPLLRNIVGQSVNRLDVRKVMDQSGILLVNLSKGRVGDDASMLLGSFLVTAVQLAAMSRADQKEEDRRDFHLYVDEFQNYATDSFATILSEARKYRLTLTLANQFLGQIGEEIRSAVFGNVGSLVCFQCGAEDAEILAEQLGGDMTPKDLLTLPRYQAYARLLINGQPSRPFSLETLPPPEPQDPKRAAIIRQVSRRRYARPREAVEREVRQQYQGM